MPATAVPLNDLEGHSPVAGLFKCNPSNIYTSFYRISTDSVLARFLCISRASCCVMCISSLLLFGCQYQCNWLPGRTRPWNVSSGMLSPTHSLTYNGVFDKQTLCLYDITFGVQLMLSFVFSNPSVCASMIMHVTMNPLARYVSYANWPSATVFLNFWSFTSNRCV